MDKIPIIDERNKDYFLYFGEKDQRRVKFIELISKGGSCLVYRAELIDNDTCVQCIVKEYYPNEEYITVPGVKYVREKAGEPIKIISEFGRKEDCIEELQNQENNVDRELRTNHKLFYEEDISVSNNPYIYRAYLAPKMNARDTSYIVLDTSEGKTLKKAIEDIDTSRPGFEWDIAINYTKKLLEIIRYISNKGFVHGDISLENVWIAGENENEHLLLLDFGSAFYRGDYFVEDLTNEEEVKNIANCILNNVAMGSSHDNTRSFLITALHDAKMVYMNVKSSEDALKLVSTVNQIDIRVDIHSCIKVFFAMLTGRTYDSCHTLQGVADALGKKENDVLVKMLHTIMVRNNQLLYDTIDKINADLNELIGMLKKECSPMCLINGIDEEIGRDEFECDDKLFAPIEEKRKPTVMTSIFS